MAYVLRCSAERLAAAVIDCAHDWEPWKHLDADAVVGVEEPLLCGMMDLSNNAEVNALLRLFVH